MVRKDTRTPVFIAALFTIAKTWKQPKCPSMDLEIIKLSEVSQTEKDKFHMVSLICGIQKNDTDELIYKTETDSQTYGMNLWLPEGKGAGEG